MVCIYITESHRITEWKDMLSWNVLTRIIASSPWPCTGLSPRVTPCAWEHCPDVSWILTGLVLDDFPKTCSSVQPQVRKKFKHLPNPPHLYMQLLGKEMLSALQCPGREQNTPLPLLWFTKYAEHFLLTYHSTAKISVTCTVAEDCSPPA